NGTSWHPEQAEVEREAVEIIRQQAAAAGGRLRGLKGPAAAAAEGAGTAGTSGMAPGSVALGGAATAAAAAAEETPRARLQAHPPADVHTLAERVMAARKLRRRRIHRAGSNSGPAGAGA
ncbi:unnamed protein product, partial [Phaeothamnion confervicola]